MTPPNGCTANHAGARPTSAHPQGVRNTRPLTRHAMGPAIGELPVAGPPIFCGTNTLASAASPENRISGVDSNAAIDVRGSLHRPPLWHHITCRRSVFHIRSRATSTPRRPYLKVTQRVTRSHFKRKAWRLKCFKSLLGLALRE